MDENELREFLKKHFGDIDIKEVNDNIGKLGASMLDFRKQLEVVEKRGGGSAEIKSATEKIAEGLVEQFVSKQQYDILQTRMDAVQTRFDNHKFEQVEAGINPTEHRLAVRDMIRTGCGTLSGHGIQELKPETVAFFASPEYRTLTEAVPTAGGIFVDPEFEKEILKNIVDVDPVRSVATIRNLTFSDRVKGWRRSGTPSASWETETGSGSDSEAQWTSFEIPVHALISKTPVSGDLLRDVGFIEAEIQEDAGQQFANTEGVAYVNGTGSGQPRGFTVGVGSDATRFAASINSASTDVIGGDDIIALYTTLKAPYRPNSTYAFNSVSFKQILQLKAGAANQYLWIPGLSNQPPEIIYGRPYIICESLPDAAGDVYPVWLADFKQAYKIVDRTGIELLRDPYTIWPKVYFKMRKLTGGQLVKGEAIKALKTT